MSSMILNFFKGIVVGIGGIAPGLSGSVLLVIFGLYERVVSTIGSIFKDLKKNLMFLVPLFGGFGVGVLLFSKIVKFLLANFEMQTRFAFLGLVLGTIPLLLKEVKKKGFSKKYYLVMLVAAVASFVFFQFYKSPDVTDPSVIQSVVLGFAVAGSYIVPGVDSAVILSSLGLYELYNNSLADMNFNVLIPAAVGLGIGVLLISFVMSKLLKKFYTITFSIIFGFFISIIPRVLNESCVVGFNLITYLSFALMILGFCLSFYLGDIKGNNARIRKILKKG